MPARSRRLWAIKTPQGHIEWHTAATTKYESWDIWAGVWVAGPRQYIDDAQESGYRAVRVRVVEEE